MQYPDSIEVDLMTASGPSGFHRYTFASKDEVAQVVDWYEERMGGGTRTKDDEWCWQKISSVGVQETIRVWPVTPIWLDRLPPEERSQFRTVIFREDRYLKEKSWGDSSRTTKFFWFGLFIGLAVSILSIIFFLLLVRR